MAVGGAAYLVSKAIRASRVVAFGDLGMEAIYEFEVKDMPVTVAVDARGESVHETGPARMARPHQGHPGARRRRPVTLEYAILLPPTALAFLTGFVWLRMGSDRLARAARAAHSSAAGRDARSR